MFPPGQAFQSLDQKPTWLVPYLIILVVVIVAQFITLDIHLSDRLALMETQDIPAESMEAARAQMQGPFKYIGIVMTPLIMLIIWAIFGGVLLLTANLTLSSAGGESSFKKIFSIVAWSSLVSVLAVILTTFITLSKGTAYGVGTDLAPLIGTPPIGEEKTVLYRLFSKLDIFTIWQLVLWAIGLGVVYRVSAKKAAIPVLILWGSGL